MKNLESVLKSYEIPLVELCIFEADVVTASDSNDNNFGDIDWE